MNLGPAYLPLINWLHNAVHSFDHYLYSWIILLEDGEM